jgi:putative phosphoesterase
VRILAEADLILHVGDFTAAGVLEELRRLAPVEAVFGNMDEAALRTALPERHVVEAEGLRIGLVHDPGPPSGRHDRLVAAFPSCDAVAYGHTHIADMRRVGSVWVLNPGSPTERRRAPSHTMIVVESGEPELVQLY